MISKKNKRKAQERGSSAFFLQKMQLSYAKHGVLLAHFFKNTRFFYKNQTKNRICLENQSYQD